MSSTVAIFIGIASMFIVLEYVQKLKFAKYQSSSVKLYLARAGVGTVLAFVLSATLYFLLSLSLEYFF
jgi:hypothetical protein